MFSLRCLCTKDKKQKRAKNIHNTRKDCKVTMACNVHLVFTIMQVVPFCPLKEEDYKIYTCFMYTPDTWTFCQHHGWLLGCPSSWLLNVEPCPVLVWIKLLRPSKPWLKRNSIYQFQYFPVCKHEELRWTLQRNMTVKTSQVVFNKKEMI